MEILVQKYGGTSTATPESRENIYKKIEGQLALGKSLVVVISAMGRSGDPYATDTLLGLLKKEIPTLSPREYDMIFSCGEIISGCIVTSALQSRGHKAIYLTGQQAGIVTDTNHTDAKILKVNTEKIMRHLQEGYVVIVAGGQGATEDGEITSLGRGGSDTTGCALGVALHASQIEIYTDVEGIMTGDPRKVKEARLLKSITHEDCVNIANNGAKVMHPRSVETAAKDKNIKLYVKSTFTDYIGTLIGKDENTPTGESYLIGIASVNESDGIVISLLGNGLDKDTGLPVRVETALALHGIPIQSFSTHVDAIKVKVAEQDFEKAINELHKLIR